MPDRFHYYLLSLPLLCCVVAAFGAEADTPAPQAPEVAAASSEAQHAIATFQIPASLEASVFAAEPLVANPVAFCLDQQGRVFVCETFRQKKGVEDNRSHPDWLDDDLAAQTVEDRIAYLRKHLQEGVVEYTRHDDRIRLLVDSDGDGRADEATVFADRFNNIEDGTGAGVLSYRGDVFYTCIPKLWRLRDENGDGKADSRQALHDGYGVRFAFRGHDMHGLCIGPDGRLYFSIGDRGLNVVTFDGRRLANTESGAVLRCELDGSNLEIFATGLRNPQELAFDNFGNLFTGDNNSDSGDRARWVYVVQGGDSGWRMAYQYLDDRGPFNREKIWHPHHPGQPAYIVPPVANLADGPSGLTYYPGTGLSGDDWQGRFFLCDFRGTPANSGVRTFRAEPAGAFFNLADERQFIWSILATDVDFGPDGALYISDWVNGWDGLGKGRIYRFVDPIAAEQDATKQVQALLAEGMSGRDADELVELLAHRDRRVRQEAQFALADRGAVTDLRRVAKGSADQLARLHAMWALGQLARRQNDSTAKATIVALLEDNDPEVRAQAARLVADHWTNLPTQKLVARLSDESLRVRGFAALALAQTGGPSILQPVLKMLAENDDRDPIVRHFGVMALAATDAPGQLVEAAKGGSPSERLAAAVALRRKKSPLVVSLLDDAEASVRVEAARAIHDEPIPDAMPALAKIKLGAASDVDAAWLDAMLRRVLNANFRLGESWNAQNVASVAARSDIPDSLRLEALDMLANWAAPSSRDRVLGMWRPLARRDRLIAASAFAARLNECLAAPKQVRVKAAQVAAALKLSQAGPALAELAADRTLDVEMRAGALQALATVSSPAAKKAVQTALADDSTIVRAAALSALSALDAESAMPELEKAVKQGEVAERQAALAALNKIDSTRADAAISQSLSALLRGNLPREVALDVLEAAQDKSAAEIQSKLAEYEATRQADNPLSHYRESLYGGDPARGESLFFGRAALSCVRCHKVGDRGGLVGPDLTKIAVDKKQEYLLESIVDPNRAIAKGFDSVVLITVDGLVRTGILRKETEDYVQVMSPQGETMVIPQEEIEDRRKGQSAMPEDILKQLTKRDLRDVVAYLATLKGDGEAQAAHGKAEQ